MGNQIMTSQGFCRACLLFAFFSVAVPSQAAGPAYRFLSMGRPAGTPAWGTSTYLINNYRQAVVGATNNQLYLYNGGVWTSLGALNEAPIAANVYRALAMNDSAVVVGYYTLATTTTGTKRPFRYRPGSGMDNLLPSGSCLASLVSGTVDVVPTGVSADGTVYGVATSGAAPGWATGFRVAPDNSVECLTDPTNNFSVLGATNSNGLSLGQFGPGNLIRWTTGTPSTVTPLRSGEVVNLGGMLQPGDGFLLNNVGTGAATLVQTGGAVVGGRLNPDGTLARFSFGAAAGSTVRLWVDGLNQDGQIAGRYRASDGSQRVYLANPDGTSTDFGVVSDLTPQSVVLAPRGRIITGSTSDSDVIVLDGGTSYKVRTISTGLQYQGLSKPLAINDRGDVLVHATGTNGQTNFYLLTPDLCANELTASQAALTLGPLRLNSSTGKYVQTVSVVNSTTASLPGPIAVMLTGLPSGVTVNSTAAVPACAAPGTLTVTLSDGALASGAMVRGTLQFTAPNLESITYTPIVASGN